MDTPMYVLSNLWVGVFMGNFTQVARLALTTSRSTRFRRRGKCCTIATTQLRKNIAFQYGVTI